MNPDKEHIWLRIAQYALMVGAYAYLIYKLVVFDGYAELASYFSTASCSQYIFLFFVLLLMVANVATETCKWRSLLHGVEPLGFGAALKSVLTGWMAAFFTPNRLGEFPGRVLTISSANRLSGIALGGVGSFAQILVIVACGIPSVYAFFSQSHAVTEPYKVLVGYIAVFILIIAFCLCLPKICSCLVQRKKWSGQLQSVLCTLASFGHLHFFGICLLSLLRYAIFCTQLYLMLCFFDVQLSAVQALVAIPAYYLLVTFTPSISFSEAAIRGSWAVITIGLYTKNTAAIVFAAVLLWFVNGVLPMLVGSLIKKADLSHRR